MNLMFRTVSEDKVKDRETIVLSGDQRDQVVQEEGNSMGKVSPEDKASKTSKQKRRIRGSSSNNKYLKPGALAQLRNSKASSTKSCTDLGKKRVAVLDAKKIDSNAVFQNKGTNGSPIILSPGRFRLGPIAGPLDLFKENNLQRTPRTPRSKDCESESQLESLPMELVVKILCHLHHDQLRAVFHVSQRISKAVVIARQFHFNYTTPDRSRQEILSTMTPLPTEHWPFVSKEDGKGIANSPKAPRAPRQGPRPPSRLKLTEMRQISAVLFPESFPSQYIVPSVLSKPLCKSFASNRVLFYEDELCQAVAHNKLR